MAFYSRETCDRIRDALDIVDVIGGYVNLKRNGSRYFGLCPFHTEKTGSFCVSQDSQFYHCFGCGESGDVISFLMKYENMEFPEAVETLAERAGVTIQSERGNNDSSEYRKKREDILLANKSAAGYYFKKLRSPDGERGLNYFKERGLSSEIMHEFGLGYTGTASHELYDYLKNLGFNDKLLMEAGLIVFDEKRGVRDRFFNRVMFPILDANRKVVGFGGRVMGDGQPKYLNSQESIVFNKSKTLYGLYIARRSRDPAFILCEGYMDVISAHMAGFNNAIATLGTALTEEHAALILRLKRPVYLCYDSDIAGRNAARRGYEILKRKGVNAKIIDLSPYKDPDEIVKVEGPEGFRKRIDHAENAFLAIMNWDYMEMDKDNPDSEAIFLHNLSKGIAEFPDEAVRESYIKASARRFNIEPDFLKRMVNGIGNVGLSSFSVNPVRKSQGKDVTKGQRAAYVELLFYLLEKEFYVKTKGILEKDDFSEGYSAVFSEIERSHEEGIAIKPATLAGLLDDEKEKKSLIEMFINMEENRLGKPEESIAKKDLLLRIKKASIMRINSKIDPGSVSELQKALEIARETIEVIENTDF